MPKFDISIGLTIDAETQDDARGIAIGACEHLQDTFNDDGSIDPLCSITPGATTAQSDTARIDPDTGRPIVYPAHCIIRCACYWLEPLNGGAPFLMSCPVLAGGAIDWGDAAEVGPDECAGYAEIMATLTPSR